MKLKETLLPVAFAFGIWPSWSMFAPNPIKSDSRAMVEIHFKDKQIKTKNIDESDGGFLSVLRHARWMKQIPLRERMEEGWEEEAYKGQHGC